MRASLLLVVLMAPLASAQLFSSGGILDALFAFFETILSFFGFSISGSADNVVQAGKDDIAATCYIASCS